jgi:STE24 endopeptidase
MLMWLFLAFLLGGLAVRVWLAQRQMRAVVAHRDRVPAEFAEKVSLTAHQKAADYTLAKVRFGIAGAFVSAAMLIALTLLGGLDLLFAASAQYAQAGSVLHAVMFFAALGLLTTLVDLPLEWISQFRIEQKFGFNKMTPGLFFADTAKNLGLAAALVLPLAALIVWLMNTAGALWWLWAWATLMVFQLTMLLVFPTVIAPLFNKFTPLDNALLKSRIDALLARCGFASNGVFVMDGSKRSSHGNAYFTGLSKNKRIVFYDTLIERLDGDQIEAVLAHELGHFKHKHVIKRIVWMAVISLCAFALLGWLAQQPWFYTQLGVTPLLSGSNAALALVLFMLAAPVFLFFFAPVGSWLSRKQEFEADAFAVKTSGAAPLSSALVRLYEDNAATLTPDPLHSAFYDSHPPAPVRIARLRALASA